MKSGRRFGMLRKVCAVVVASVLAAGCLTACGSSKNTGPLTLDQIKKNGKPLMSLLNTWTAIRS